MSLFPYNDPPMSQSHTELAAQCRSTADDLDHEGTTVGNILCAASIAAGLLRQYAAALESPERVLGEHDFNSLHVALRLMTEVEQRPARGVGDMQYHASQAANILREFLRAPATPPTAPAQDAQGDDEFVAWLKTRAADSYSCGLLVKDALARLSATPSPQAEADEALMRQAMDDLHYIKAMAGNPESVWHKANAAITALRARLETRT